MKKGNEKKKLNRFLSVNLSLVMCLSSIPATYTVVADEGDETEPGTGTASYSVSVKDLFEEGVEGAQIGLSLNLEDSSEKPVEVELDSASTDENGTIEIKQSEVDAALSGWMANEEVTQEQTYTMVFTVSKDGYFAGDSVEVSPEDAAKDGVDLTLAQLCDLKGSLEFIGANMTDFTPVYSISYRFDGIENYLPKDENGNPVYPELVTDGTEFTLRNAPLSKQFALTAIPGEELAVPEGSEFTSYRATTKEFELNSSADASSVLELKAEPDVLRVKFPEAQKKGVFTDADESGTEITGIIDYTPAELQEEGNQELSFKFNVAEGLTLQSMKMTVFNAESDPVTTELTADDEGVYHLDLSAFTDGYMIQFNPYMVDDTPPAISQIKLLNEAEYINWQAVEFKIEEAVSDTVTANLYRKTGDAEDAEIEPELVESVQIDLSAGKAAYRFNIVRNGDYWITVVDENGHEANSSIEGPDSEDRNYLKVEGFDDAKPELVEGSLKTIKEKNNIAVSFEITDPLNSDGTTGSGIQEVRYYSQTSSGSKVKVTPDNKGLYKFKVNCSKIVQDKDETESEFISRVLAAYIVEIKDKAGNVKRFPVSDKVYLDVSIKNSSEWSNKKTISYKLQNISGEEGDTYKISLQRVFNTSIKNDCLIYPESSEDVSENEYVITSSKSSGEFVFKGENTSGGSAEVKKCGSDQYLVSIVRINEGKESSVMYSEPIYIANLDTAGPDCDIQNPRKASTGGSNQTYWLGSARTVKFSSVDKESGFDHAEAYVKDESGEYRKINVVDSLNSSEDDIYTLSLFEEGYTPLDGDIREYKIVAVDKTGNTTETEFTGVYDITAPEPTDISIKKDKFWFLRTDNNLSFKAEENGSGLASVRIRMTNDAGEDSADTELKPNNKGVYSYSFQDYNGFNGQVAAILEDKVGNINYAAFVDEKAYVRNEKNIEEATTLEVNMYEPEEDSSAKIEDPANYWFKKSAKVTVSADLIAEQLNMVLDGQTKSSLIKSVVISPMKKDNEGKWVASDEVEITNGETILLTVDEAGQLQNNAVHIIPDDSGEVQFKVTVITAFGTKKEVSCTTKFDNQKPKIEIDKELEELLFKNEANNDKDEELTSRVFADSIHLGNNESALKLEDYESGLKGNSEDGSKISFVGTFYFATSDGNYEARQAEYVIKLPDEKTVEFEKFPNPLDYVDQDNKAVAFDGTMKIILVDNADNNANFETYRFIVDSSIPAVPAITASYPNEDGTGTNTYSVTDPNLVDGWINKPVEVTAVANHAPSGIKSIEVRDGEGNSVPFEITDDADNTDIKKIMSVAFPQNETGNIPSLNSDYNDIYTVTVTTWAEKTNQATFEVRQDLSDPEDLTIKDSQDNQLDEYKKDDPKYTRFYNSPELFSFNASFNISGRYMEEYGINSRNNLKTLGEGGNVAVGVNEWFDLLYRVTDKAGNESEKISQGIIIDNKKPEIKYELPAANENGFYNSPVTVNVNVTDPRFNGEVRADDDDEEGVFSGLSEVTYEISSASTGAVETGTLYEAVDGHLPGEEVEGVNAQFDLARVLNTSITIDPQTFNANDVVVTIKAVDNSGNEEIISTKDEEIKIDVTAPVIDIAYDNNDVRNGHYYSADRTATITITERNFNPDDVKLTVTSSNSSKELPVLSSWTTQVAGGNMDGTTHTATLTYHDDADYTFNIEYTDMAGNAASGVNYAEGTNNPTEFTVDQTKPEIKVEYNNNNDSSKYSGYFNAPRIATITVTEHNFDSEKVNIDIKAVKEDLQGKESTVSEPSKSSWRSEGDTHSITIDYEDDADYTFDIKMTDLAENSNSDVPEDRFTVDKVFDSLRIKVDYNDGNNQTDENDDTAKPTDGHAYRNLYNISIEYADINLDAGKGELSHKSNTSKNNVDMPESSVSNTAKTMRTAIDNNRPADGIYHLTAEAYDKAGNEKKSALSFSLSNFGSLYMYDQKLTEMLNSENLNKKYVQEIEDNLKITEYNPSGLKDDTIKVVLSRDGNVIEMTEDSKEEDSKDKSGPKTFEQNDEGQYITNSGWFEYNHVIPKDNFDNEGLYTITLSSTDNAGTVSQNTADKNNVISAGSESVEPKIEFFVDKNSPTLNYVNGIDSDNFKAAERQVSYSVSDTIGLGKVEIYRTNDKGEAEKLQEVIFTNGESDANSGNETIIVDGSNDKNYEGEFSINESKEKQKIHFVITDKAGRVTDSEAVNTNSEIYPKEFIMSTDWWVLFKNNKPLFYGTLTALIAIIAGGVGYFLIKNRRHDDDEEEQDTAAI